MRHHINKMIDHRWWEARPLPMRHVVYAATDADAHLKLAKAVATEDQTPAGAVDDESDEAVEDFEDELGGFGEHPVLPSSSEACTRHRSAGESLPTRTNFHRRICHQPSPTSHFDFNRSRLRRSHPLSRGRSRTPLAEIKQRTTANSMSNDVRTRPISNAMRDGQGRLLKDRSSDATR